MQILISKIHPNIPIRVLDLHTLRKLYTLCIIVPTSMFDAAPPPIVSPFAKIIQLLIPKYIHIITKIIQTIPCMTFASNKVNFLAVQHHLSIILFLFIFFTRNISNLCRMWRRRKRIGHPCTLLFLKPIHIHPNQSLTYTLKEFYNLPTNINV